MQDRPMGMDDEPVKFLGIFGKKKKQAKPHMVRVFTSPGRLEGKQGALIARPTATGAGKPLNQVHFKKGAQLLFSDGSFRTPGRRRLQVVVTKTGQETVLSGRQLRKARKVARRVAKAKVAMMTGQPA